MNKKLIFAVLILFIAISFLSDMISRDKKIFFPVSYKEQYSVTQQLINGLLGQFGKTVAGYLWIKADFYSHEYKGDWRSETDYMPLLKMITFLDPNFTQAYSFGGYHLAKNLDKQHEGIAYLKEGLQYNPNNYDINYTLAFIYFRKSKNYYGAMKYAEKALKLSKEDTDKMNCYRIIYNSQDKLGLYQDEINTLEEMIKLSIGNKVYENKLEEVRKKIKGKK